MREGKKTSLLATYVDFSVLFVPIAFFRFVLFYFVFRFSNKI